MKGRPPRVAGAGAVCAGDAAGIFLRDRVLFRVLFRVLSDAGDGTGAFCE